MDPITLLLIASGFKSMEELMCAMGYTENTVLQPMRYQDFVPDDDVIKRINVYENGLFNKFIETAYIPKGDHLPTFGIGTASLFRKDGSFYRDVKLGDTITGVKVEMGYSNLSNLAFCRQLVLNYLSNNNKYKLIAKMLDSYGVPFYRNLAFALYDFSFNSGGAFHKTANKAFVESVKLANGNMKRIASAYLGFRWGYVFKAAVLNVYRSNRNGWARRYYHNAKFIEGVDLDYSKISVNGALSNSFSDYGYLVPVR